MTATARILPFCAVLFLAIGVPLLALPHHAGKRVTGTPPEQRGRGGQGTGISEAPKPTGEIVRVKAGHANIHTGPTSGNEVLVLAAKGTLLPVLARRGEWIQVSLSPALRKTGMVMRWYKNENNGWLHDSMVDVVKPAEKKD
jgi:hypothetical protein